MDIIILVLIVAVFGMVLAVIIHKHKTLHKSEKPELRPPADDGLGKKEENGKKSEEGQMPANEKKEGEEDEPKTSNGDEKERNGEKLTPDNIGGRPRGTKVQNATATTREPKPSLFKPEIICWNKGWEWIVGIEVPEEFESLAVTQNDELLEQDISDSTLYHLKHFEGIVRVAWTGGEHKREIDIPIRKDERKYLIFKMRKDWKEVGRMVNRPSSGYYLAIVPEGWRRNEELSGPAPIKSENVRIDGYKAHFFALRQNENTSIAFIGSNDEQINVETRRSRFQLAGKEIFDFAENMGPLFGEKPPLIETLNEQDWDNIGAVVIGEEGRGRKRWRTHFVPLKGDKKQKMPDDLTNRKGGWYFIRIYDNNYDLLESMDFRFSAGLKNIEKTNSECVPKPNGYENVTVKFIHQADCKVEPVDGEMCNALKIRRENGLTIASIPPKPDFDKTHWIVKDGKAETNVTVLMERIWWNVGKIGVVSTEWTDQPLSLSRKDFSATSEKALWIKLPRKRWVSEIKVGFHSTRSRSFKVDVEKEEVEIPLYTFCDTMEVEKRQEEFAMKIWIPNNGNMSYEATVLTIPVESFSSVEPESSPALPLSMFKAEVMSPNGKRIGKGFSRREVNEVKLTKCDIKRLLIPFDKRRKSSHSWNIERLKSITER